MDMRQMYAVAIFWGVWPHVTASTTNVSETKNATSTTFVDDRHQHMHPVMNKHVQVDARSTHFNNETSLTKFKINSIIEGPNNDEAIEANYEYVTSISEDDITSEKETIGHTKDKQQVTTATMNVEKCHGLCDKKMYAIVILVMTFICIAFMVSTIILGCKVALSADTKNGEVQRDHLICISAMTGETQPFAFDLVTGAALPEQSGSMHRMSLINTRTLV